jgi:hypothetical protein
MRSLTPASPTLRMTRVLMSLTHTCILRTMFLAVLKKNDLRPHRLFHQRPIQHLPDFSGQS